MSAEVKIQRTGYRIQLSVEFTMRAATAMWDYEEQIVDGLNRVRQALNVQCLDKFDTDGAPIVIAGTKLNRKGPVQGNCQSPYTEVEGWWHVYPSSAGGQTFCPLNQQARIEQGSHRLKQEPGAAAKPLQEMQQAQEGRRLARGVREDLQRAFTYFENHLDKVNYAQYRRRHWPIGSPYPDQGLLATVLEQNKPIRVLITYTAPTALPMAVPTLN